MLRKYEKKQKNRPVKNIYLYKKLLQQISRLSLSIKRETHMYINVHITAVEKEKKSNSISFVKHMHHLHQAN